jgi:hypothetical protein
METEEWGEKNKREGPGGGDEDGNNHSQGLAITRCLNEFILYFPETPSLQQH